jgi:hypothetical protein
VNFNYFISDEVFEYLVRAVDLLATHGWRLLPEYRFDARTGLWTHRSGPVEPPIRLGQVNYDSDGNLRFPNQHDRAPESELKTYLAFAEDLLTGLPMPDLTHSSQSVSSDFESLRWFDLPKECLTTTSS